MYKLKVRRGEIEVEAQAPGAEEALNLLSKLTEIAEEIPYDGSAKGGTSWVPSSNNVALDAFDTTATGRVRYLLSTGFFSTPRTLSDTREELSKIGFGFNVKTVDKALRILTRKGLLRRLGSRKNYEYVEAR